MGRVLAPGEYAFEDLAPGDTFETGGIMVTEAHVVGFAGLSGDLFDVHMDEDFARAQGFAGRVAHGLLGLALADGLKNRASVRLQAIASLGWSWSFRAPILIGDRIRALCTVKALRPTRRPERGVLELELVVLNQREETVQEGATTLMLRRRAAQDAAGAAPA